MTQKALEKLVKKWQRVLGLLHWDISVYLVRAIEGGPEGLCKAQRDYLMASIYIVDPKYHPKPELYRLEETLVHELLHCHLSAFDFEDNSLHGAYEEQLVTTLSRAFMGSASAD